jgi:hypothetical protein
MGGARCWWLLPVIIATWETEMYRTLVQGQPRQIVLKAPISKNNQSKVNWRCGLSHRVPVLQVQGPEFKHQSHQKNKDK